MKLWQQYAMESTLLDVEGWLDHASICRAYNKLENPRDKALEAKALACARRMCPNVKDVDLPLAVISKRKEKSYLDRAEKEVIKEADRQQEILYSEQQKIESEKNRIEELRSEILEMKSEGLI